MLGIVVNPVSGKGKSGEIAARAQGTLAARGIESRVYETQCPGDGERAARAALMDGCTAIACVGGDGTLGEAAGALMNTGVPLYILPGGTGNDFARAFGLPKDPDEALAAQLAGVPTRIDCGTVNGRAFLNVAGSGFDVEVLRKTEELKKIYPGPKAYRKAVAQSLVTYRSREAELICDGGETMRTRSTIVEIANGQYIGGGMRVAPFAKMDDGVFDVVVVSRVPRGIIPLLLPLFILGVHVHLPVAKVLRAKRVTLRAPGMTIEADGRLERMDEAAFEVNPGALVLMRPKK